MKSHNLEILLFDSPDQPTEETRAASALMAPPKDERAADFATFGAMINRVWGCHFDHVSMIRWTEL
jgi:hypothetical protein